MSDTSAGDTSAARSAPPPSEPPTAFDAVEWQSAVLVRHFELLRRRSDGHDELDRAEYLLLRILQGKGPATINTLAGLLGLDPSTAGRQVATMQAAGLVNRAPAPQDRRCSVISPSEEGLRRMAVVRQRRTDGVAELLADWSENDVRELGQMFARYNRAVAQRYLSGDSADQ